MGNDLLFTPCGRPALAAHAFVDILLTFKVKYILAYICESLGATRHTLSVEFLSNNLLLAER